MAKFEEISFTSAHEIKADRRILKTKKAIYEALVELMQKKKLNSITVTELAAQADINRKTFYTYYSTVNDVLDEGINELITSLKDLLCAMSEDYNMFSPQTLFAFLNTIMSDADIARDDLCRQGEEPGTCGFPDCLLSDTGGILCGDALLL